LRELEARYVGTLAVRDCVGLDGCFYFRAFGMDGVFYVGLLAEA